MFRFLLVVVFVVFSLFESESKESPRITIHWASKVVQW